MNVVVLKQKFCFKLYGGCLTEYHHGSAHLSAPTSVAKVDDPGIGRTTAAPSVRDDLGEPPDCCERH
jgi:hypothetical protein